MLEKPPSVSQLLLARVQSPRASISSGFPADTGSVSRRKFLVSATGAVFVASVAFAVQAPRVWSRGRSIYVEYAGRTWRLNAGHFGREARIEWRRKGRGHFIALHDARLPGVYTPLSLRVQIFPRWGQWQIHGQVDPWRLEGTAPLSEWMSAEMGLDGSAHVSDLEVAKLLISSSGSCKATFLSPFRLVFESSDHGIRTDSGLLPAARRIEISLEAQSRGSFCRALLARRAPRHTVVTLTGGGVEGNEVPVGLSGRGSPVIFMPRGEGTARLEAMSLDNSQYGVLVYEGPGTVVIRDLGTSHRAGIQLERAALMRSTTHENADIALAGRVSRRPHIVEAGGAQATIAGLDESPFYMRAVRGKAETAVAVELQRLAWPINGDESAEAAFNRKQLTLHFADRPALGHAAALDTAKSTPATAAVASECPEPPTLPPQEPRGDLMVVGDSGYVLASLSDAEIRVTRGTDLLNLTFKFSGFDIRVESWAGEPGKAFLERHKPPSKATVTVRFPPQHVAEEWFHAQNPWACMADPPCFPDVTRARASGPSQIVFAVGAEEWKKQPFTIDKLTDWAGLAMQVDPRALPSDAPFAQQMALLGIDEKTLLSQAITKLNASIQPPSDDVTQLEVIGRLIVSPASGSHWVTPSSPPDPSQALLWSARLESGGRQSVRALWSRYMTPGALGCALQPDDNTPFNCGVKPGSERLAAPHLLVLESDDHWQIVAQTSVYGLPALRRIEAQTTQPPKDPIQAALQSLPRSRVIRATSASGVEFALLGELDGIQCGTTKINPGDAGIAIPVPFDSADIMLTSIGAIMEADWHGEPPSMLRGRDCRPIAPPLGLERLGYRTYLGRDIRIEVVKKGYLLPLSIRASYVQLTERMFFRHPRFGSPYAYPVQRQFIIVQRPVKNYPAVNQPYDSRDFPVDRLTMLTTVTPDLVDPGSGMQQPPLATFPDGTELRGGGRLKFPAQSATGFPDIKIFWPRISGGLASTTGDVDFKWTVNDDTTPARCNLLFIETEATVLPDLMQQIVYFYRCLGTEGFQPTYPKGATGPNDVDFLTLRTARMGGSRRKYAPADRSGSTSFDTDSWILSARGALSTVSAGSLVEQFGMDGRMEGGDQPPCYPFLASANVNIQSIDRMVGEPQGLISTGFNDLYRDWGLKHRNNPSDIYLNILHPDIQLNVTGKSGATLGPAQPNVLAVALATGIGIVGGQKLREARPPKKAAKSGRTRPRITLPQVPSPSGPDSPYNFDAARKGDFSPAEFLSGATLFGLVSLASVAQRGAIAAAPALVESLGFGPLGEATEQEALAQIQALFRPVESQISSELSSASTLLGSPTGVPNLKVSDIYPELAARLEALQEVFQKSVDAILNAQQWSAATQPLDDIVQAAQPFIAELERTISDPVPPILRVVLNEIAGQWIDLKNRVGAEFLLLGQPHAARKSIVQAVMDEAVAAFCASAASSGLEAELLGTTQDITCADLLADPADVLIATSRSLFEGATSEPIRRAATAARTFESTVTAKVPWNSASIRRYILGCISQGALLLQDRLVAPQSPTDPDNILADPAQGALRDAMVAALMGDLSSILDGAPAATSLAEVREKVIENEQLLGTVPPALLASLGSVVDAQQSAFKAKVAGDLPQILSDFKQSVIKPVVDMVLNDLSQKLQALDKILIGQISETRADAVHHVLTAIVDVAGPLTNVIRYAGAAAAGRQVNAWCNIAGGAAADIVKIAQSLGDGLLATDAAIAATLANLLGLTDQLQPPPGVPTAPFNQAKAALKSAVQQLADTAAAVAGARAKLAAAVSDAQRCIIPGIFIGPVALLYGLRTEAISKLVSIADAIAAVERLAGGSGPPPPALAALIQQLVLASAQSVQQLTSVGQVPNAHAWRTVNDTINAIASGGQFAPLKALDGYAVLLANTAQQVLSEAATLQADLSSSSLGTAALKDALAGVQAFTKEADKALASDLLQTFTLSAGDAQAVFQNAAVGIADVARLAAELHQIALVPLQALVSAVNQPNVSAILGLALGDAKVVQKFTDSVNQVSMDAASLAAIDAARADPIQCAVLTEKLLARWYPANPPPGALQSGPALEGIVITLSTLVESLLKGDLGDVLSKFNITPALRALLGDLESAISQCIPTSTDLRYDWSTQLSPAPTENSYVFKMQDASNTEDLKISAHVSIDFLTGARSASVVGELRPFELWLVTESIDIAKILFRKASFTLAPGASPAFSAEIETVQLGALVQFIQPLQQWLSPSKGGFFLRPTANPVGIEAGYVYSSTLIQLGTLQFINIDIGATAQLPFDGSEALFGFHVGTAANPFEVAQPPYGGTGSVELWANASGIKSFSLSIGFGAIVAIVFGPLQARGRVTAGIYLASAAGGGRIIAAYVEAVGEGNIACFSICVYIRVGLVQQVDASGNSTLYGYAQYSFTFKVGFIGISVGFTANYTIQGNKRAGGKLSGGSSPSLEIVAAGGAAVRTDADRRYTVLTPRKQSEWGKYRRHLAFELL
jgi:hypothetical protein